MVANTTTLATEDTNTVCFIHHHRSSIFLFELNDFGQIAEVTFHRENTIHNDEFHGILFTLLEFALQILHIVVLIAQLFCHRQTASVYDRSMVAIVANHIVVRTKECRNHTTVHRKSSGETEGFVLTHKLSEFFFQFHMKVERTIQETATRTACTITAHGLHTCLNDTFVSRQTSVGIRSQHNDVMTVHFNFCALLPFDFAEIGIKTLLSHLIRESKLR